MQIGNLHIGFTPKAEKITPLESVPKGEFFKSVESTFAQSISLVGSNLNFRNFEFQNYRANEVIERGYLQNATVAACVSNYQQAYPEPEKLALRGEKPITDSQILSIVNEPNEWMSADDLDNHIISNQLWGGNTYLLQLPDTQGRMMQIFPFGDANMYPVATPQNFIDHFVFITSEGQKTQIPKQYVTHLPWYTIDPKKRYMGNSPIQLCSTEIMTDTEATKFVYWFIKNGAVMGIVATMTGKDAENKVNLSEDTANAIKAAINEGFTGDNRGQTAVLKPGWSVETVGSPLKDLDLSNVKAHPQILICANFNIPPEIVPIEAGMRNSTFNNYTESRTRWYQTALTPLWKMNAKKISKGYSRVFGSDFKFEYNLESVATLKEIHKEELIKRSDAVRVLQEDYYIKGLPREAVMQNAIRFYGLEQKEADDLFPEKPMEPTPQPITIGKNGKLNGALVV